MTETELLDPFDEGVVETVASEAEVDSDHLRTLLQRHQEHARSMPGVDDLVYEWRRFLRYEPLVERRDEAYYLVLEPSVWAEFAAQLSISNDELSLLRRVHDRQARLAIDGGNGHDSENETPFDGGAAMVLTR